MRRHPKWQRNAKLCNTTWSLYLTRRDGKFHSSHSISSKCSVFKAFRSIFEIIWKIRLCSFQDCWLWDCFLLRRMGKGQTRQSEVLPCALAVGLSLSALEPPLLYTIYSSWNLKPTHTYEFDVWLRHYPGKMLTWAIFCLQSQVNGLPLASVGFTHHSLTGAYNLQFPIIYYTLSFRLGQRQAKIAALDAQKRHW